VSKTKKREVKVRLFGVLKMHKKQAALCRKLNKILFLVSFFKQSRSRMKTGEMPQVFLFCADKKGPAAHFSPVDAH